MSVLQEQIAKAIAKQDGFDIPAAVDAARNKTPAALATDRQKSDRLDFIATHERPIGESPVEVLERIIGGNEIQDVNYLARGARVAQAICRITIVDEVGRNLGRGTGFLVAPNVLITNNHVLPRLGVAARSFAEFEYELDILGSPVRPRRFLLRAEELFYTSLKLDFAVVAVERLASEDRIPLERYGFLPLIGVAGKALDGEWLTVIQHPGGQRKQLCVRENKLIKRTQDVLWYSTDTLGGSSGSPVFNNEWFVVALHHSGIPEMKDGRVQTVDGRDFDPARDGEDNIKWIANEGIRVSRIVQDLQQALPNHPLLQPMLRATPDYSRLQLLSQPLSARHELAPIAANNPRSRNMDSDTRLLTFTLAIAPDGSTSLVGTGPTQAAEAFIEAAKKRNGAEGAAYDIPFDSDYSKRKGYNPDFLNRSGNGANDAGQKKKGHSSAANGKYSVQLPELSAALKAVAAPLLEEPKEHELKYHNYSLVMHQHRRLAIYTAANVDFSGRFDLRRPKDVWRTDPRIPGEAQIGEFYYRANQFDRGHLTRREDLEYGGTYKRALVSAADTCHFTNCTPQHSRFNQNKQLWQGIERHVLEDAIEAEQFRAVVFTGPVLDEDDPVWDRFPKIKYPVRFWKVVAAVNAKEKLFATAYILDQSEVIARFGIEAAPEVPFEPFKTFQVRVDEIERLTGLTFLCGGTGADRLSKYDPLQDKKIRPKKIVGGLESSAAGLWAPEGYLPIDNLDSIVTE